MANERSYIVKLENGEEFGPIDQEALVRQAESGRINYQAQVRSVLVPRWEKAVNLPFLKPILQSQLEKALLAEKLSFWGKIVRRATLKVDGTVATGSLVKVKAESFERAKMLVRVMAAILDLLVLFIGTLFLTGLCYALLKMQVLTTYNAAYFLLLMNFAWLMGYYILFVTLNVQTLGQKFWGVFLVRLTGEKFYYGRVFFYTIFLLFFGLFTPFHVLLSPSKRSWQEILTGTKMVKTKLSNSRKVR